MSKTTTEHGDVLLSIPRTRLKKITTRIVSSLTAGTFEWEGIDTRSIVFLSFYYESQCKNARVTHIRVWRSHWLVLFSINVMLDLDKKDNKSLEEWHHA